MYSSALRDATHDRPETVEVHSWPNAISFARFCSGKRRPPSSPPSSPSRALDHPYASPRSSTTVSSASQRGAWRVRQSDRLASRAGAATNENSECCAGSFVHRAPGAARAKRDSAPLTVLRRWRTASLQSGAARDRRPDDRARPRSSARRECRARSGERGDISRS